MEEDFHTKGTKSIFCAGVYYSIITKKGNMKKVLIKRGRRIKGFVYQNNAGEWYYAFGKPSQDNYISFKCRDKEHGMACVEMN